MGIREISRRLSRLVADVETSGQAVVVARHGKPVAALVPLDSAGAEELLSRHIGRLARRRPRSVADLPAPIPRLLRDLRKGLDRLYGDRLRGLYVFGSYARGEADPRESDLDVAIVLDRVGRHGRDIDATSDLTYDALMRFGVLVNTIFVAWGDWRGADSPFLRSARGDALAA